MEFGIFRRKPDGPVSELLRNVARNNFHYDFDERLRLYLEWAQFCGLDGDPIVSSCIDLAQSYTTDPHYRYINQYKIREWQLARDAALAVDRPPGEILMKLDPLYFRLIQNQEKTVEGRAYNPDSAYRYADIRPGDSIRFTVDQRLPDWEEQCRQYGLSPDAVMAGAVVGVHFAPLVHSLFREVGGRLLQPTVGSASEILELQRAAVYYTFPDYPERIFDHGFIGLEIENPLMIASA